VREDELVVGATAGGGVGDEVSRSGKHDDKLDRTEEKRSVAVETSKTTELWRAKRYTPSSPMTSRGASGALTNARFKICCTLILEQLL
jgi:hypothetical protein